MGTNGSPIVFGVYKGMIMVETNNISSYLRSAEKFLEDEVKKLEKKFGDEKSKLTEEEQSEFAEYYAEIYRELTEEFPRLLRNSLFVLSYSVTENYLNYYCNRSEKHFGLKLTLSDLKGRGVERAKNYLKKVAEIDFPENDEWAEIKHYNRIRNFIVHNNGKLDDSSNAGKVEKYIKAKPDLLELKEFSINKKIVSKSIVIKQGFCEEVLKTAKDFLFRLDGAYQARAGKKNT